MDNNIIQKRVRVIKNVQEEGFVFDLVRRYVAYFYTTIMKGQVRQDTPNTLIKYTRDWEYAWVLIKSEIQPNNRILDCGSGYSPVPFIWSQFGGEVYAIDRDARISSMFMSALRSPISLLSQTAKYPFYILRKIIMKDFRFLSDYPWGRPSFYGPVSPKLLKQYQVTYQKGDITALPHKDGSFDIVSCISVLEHMNECDRMKCVKEMARVVKLGGKLIITYDKRENETDLTGLFIDESGMIPNEITHFVPDISRLHNRPSVIGVCLVKQR